MNLNVLKKTMKQIVYLIKVGLIMIQEFQPYMTFLDKMKIKLKRQTQKKNSNIVNGYKSFNNLNSLKDLYQQANYYYLKI